MKKKKFLKMQKGWQKPLIEERQTIQRPIEKRQKRQYTENKLIKDPFLQFCDVFP